MQSLKSLAALVSKIWAKQDFDSYFEPLGGTILCPKYKYCQVVSFSICTHIESFLRLLLKYFFHGWFNALRQTDIHCTHMGQRFDLIESLKIGDWLHHWPVPLWASEFFAGIIYFLQLQKYGNSKTPGQIIICINSRIHQYWNPLHDFSMNVFLNAYFKRLYTKKQRHWFILIRTCFYLSLLAKLMIQCTFLHYVTKCWENLHPILGI